MTQLSPQQIEGIQKIKAWYSSADQKAAADWGGGASVFRLQGPAGTGKTTMATQIPALLGLDNVVYGTYTGKAAHVLRTKGASPVSTIHSAIYMPTGDAEARQRLEDARTELAELEPRRATARNTLASAVSTGMHVEDVSLVERDALEMDKRIAELEAQIPALEADARRMRWEFDPLGKWSGADLIMLDEVSMVDAKMAADIESYGVPIIVIGDPAQLPPVQGEGYYDGTPDHLLTEVHRTALENPITALATRVRESADVSLGLTPADMAPAAIAEAAQHDQVIVWTNKRRWALINAIRNLRALPPGQVVPSDTIMCLTNNRDLAVFNGQQFEVLEVAPGALGPTLTLRSDNGLVREIPVFQDGFMGLELQNQAKGSGAGMRGTRMLATFAQAITCHKAQGSEYGSVYVVNETPGMIGMARNKPGGIERGIEDARRWAYTAITRARDKVTITVPPSRGR
jgi:exodeoxyribonuclease V